MGRVEVKELLSYILRDAKLEIRSFNRKSYEGQMDILISNHVNTLVEVENLYHLENDNIEVLEDLATAFSDYAYKEMESLNKRNKQVAMIDYNMSMVSFVLPMIGKRRDQFMDVFAELCVTAWNTKFPKTHIEKSSQDAIQGGFKSKLCYITTAVCDSMHKADDCYELTLLREYRDNYLLNETEDGTQIIQEYYDIAPTIVKRIGKEEDATLIYQGIWEDYLQPCIHYIEEDQNEVSKELYTAMVKELANKYIY